MSCKVNEYENCKETKEKKRTLLINVSLTSIRSKARITRKKEIIMNRRIHRSNFEMEFWREFS